MSRKLIPAREIVQCDICLNPDAKRKEDGSLTIHRDGLDYQGRAVGDASIKRDLCDSCLNRVIISLNELTVDIRKGK